MHSKQATRTIGLDYAILIGEAQPPASCMRGRSSMASRQARRLLASCSQARSARLARWARHVFVCLVFACLARVRRKAFCRIPWSSGPRPPRTWIGCMQKSWGSWLVWAPVERKCGGGGVRVTCNHQARGLDVHDFAEGMLDAKAKVGVRD